MALIFPGYPNDQGNPNASVPVWLDVAPTPGPNGAYPNDPTQTGGARPVYEVPAPVPGAPYPNDQGSATGINRGAFPVRIVPKPPAGPPFFNDPADDRSAKPIWVVGSATGLLTVYPTDQALPAGAMPIYLTGSALAAQAMTILASFPAGTVHMYLPTNAYAPDGTTPATNGGTVGLVKDPQGNVNMASTSNDLAAPTLSVANGYTALVFTGGAGQSLHSASPLYHMANDHCLIAGMACTNPDNAGVPLIAPACNLTTYAKAASLYFTSLTQVTARWTSDTPADFSIVGACPNAPIVATVYKAGTTGHLRINGAEKGTVNLTGVTATCNTGNIGPWVIPPAAAAVQGGQLYPFVTIDATVTPQNILFLERWINSLTPTGVTF